MITWTSTYQNNRGQYSIQTMRHLSDKEAGALDEIKITAAKRDGSHEFLGNSELGFMMMLIEHANKDPKFKESLHKVVAELGLSEDALLNALTQANRTVQEQQNLIISLKSNLEKVQETLSELDIMKTQNAIPLIKHIKSLNLTEQAREIRKVLSLANGPPPGFTGAWA